MEDITSKQSRDPMRLWDFINPPCGRADLFGSLLGVHGCASYYFFATHDLSDCGSKRYARRIRGHREPTQRSMGRWLERRMVGPGHERRYCRLTVLEALRCVF